MVGATLSGGVIVLAGVVNGVAGVLAMSMGTFLSSQAERDAMLASGVVAPVTRSPLRDAGVMAAAYAVGAALPLLPFTLPFIGRSVAMAVAMVLTAIGLFALGMLKGALSRLGRLRTGLQLLALASGAGVAGYLIGVLARAVFGVSA